MSSTAPETVRRPRLLEWHDLGTCREPDRDPDLWAEETGKRAQQARALCWMHCRVRVRCLTYTLDREPATDQASHRYGIAGGLTPRERAQLARDMRDRNKAAAA